jgi:hypothetical protein
VAICHATRVDYYEGYDLLGVPALLGSSPVRHTSEGDLSFNKWTATLDPDRLFNHLILSFGARAWSV